MYGFGVSDMGEKVGVDKDPKCLFTRTELPAYVPLDQPPSRRKPFSTIGTAPVATLAFALPQIVYNQVKSQFDRASRLLFLRLYLRPSDLMTAEFLETHVRNGRIMMRSNGSKGRDTLFTFSGGVLRIEMDKPTYESLGLTGKSIDTTAGQKHVKARYNVEIDMAASAFREGKPVFEQAKRALSSVFPDQILWRYIDLNNLHGETMNGPIGSTVKETRRAIPDMCFSRDCQVPYLGPNLEMGDQEDAADLFEWSSLLLARSPRLLNKDQTDRFYSSYSVPSLPVRIGSDRPDGKKKMNDEDGQVRTDEDGKPTRSTDADISITTSSQPVVQTRRTAPSEREVIIFTWSGYLPAEMVKELWMIVHSRTAFLIDGVRLPAPSPNLDDWTLMKATTFTTQAYAVVSIGKRDILTWECWD